MSDLDDIKKEMQAQKEKLEALEKKNSELSGQLDEHKTAKLDIQKQRDELKAKLKDAESGKETDNATTEQLKELLKQKEAELTKNTEARQSDKIEAKLMQAALKANFVKNKDGSIDKALLKSQFDIGKLHLDEDGEIIGIDSIVNKVRENSSYLFDKKKASQKETRDDPESKKGIDLSDEALDKETDFHKRREIMDKRAAQYEADNKSNLPSGMGKTTGTAKEAEASATQSEGDS